MTGAEARARRIAIGATQLDVATVAGVRARTVGAFERGEARRRGPQASTGAAILGALAILEAERGIRSDAIKKSLARQLAIKENAVPGIVERCG